MYVYIILNKLQQNMFYKRKVTIYWSLTIQLTSVLCVILGERVLVLVSAF